ncbi:hypothetical protein [Sulfitobacter sp. SK011]|uniref:hypothetical protein n=1 Tax=Sulfitobacter sp. SK011 TaxID=1389004 RepID=UPI000E0BD7E4|nr:hypothetical protein [Sulfitobacter sp. SK011]AXI41470.1 hypothetical protein C1J02_05505 [Sulfitobacter sp. SK011]
MKSVLIVGAVLTLAACGVDGEPIYPTASSAVTLSNHGVSVGTNVALNQGPLWVSLGLGL